eukprot:357826-Chlamydomonas_euryale.AAC.7
MLNDRPLQTAEGSAVRSHGGGWQLEEETRQHRLLSGSVKQRNSNLFRAGSQAPAFLNARARGSVIVSHDSVSRLSRCLQHTWVSRMHECNIAPMWWNMSNAVLSVTEFKSLQQLRIAVQQAPIDTTKDH